MEQITIEDWGAFLLAVGLVGFFFVFLFLVLPRILWRAAQLTYYKSLSKPMQNARMIEEQRKQTALLQRMLSEKREI